MNRLLIVSILIFSMAPLYAVGQQPNTARLKADAHGLVSSISRDKAKVRAYCEITDLGQQLVEAAEENDEKKADSLMQRIDVLEQILGREYRELFNALYDADANSKDVQEILSMFDRLDDSCPH